MTAATILVLSLCGAVAQDKPNFSGTWTPVEGVNPKTDLIVTHDAGRLTGRAGDDPAHQFEYRLDGTETKQPGAGDVSSKAEWDGGRLVLTDVFRAKGTVVSSRKQVWSLSADGLLVIETSRERDGKSTPGSKSTYKRAGR